MKNKLVALAVAVAGFGAAAVMPSAAAASTAHTCSTYTEYYSTCCATYAQYCTKAPGKPYVSKAGAMVIAKTSPTLAFWLHDGKGAPAIKTITIVLPKGLTWNPARFKTNGVVAGAYSVHAKGSTLLIKFQVAEPTVKLAFAKGAIVESKAFAKLVKKGKVKKVTFKLIIRDNKQKVTTINETVKVKK